MAAQSQIITFTPAATVQAVGTVTGVAQVFRQAWREITVLLNVTAAATLVGDTLDVFIETSADGGTTWHAIGHFTQVLGNGGAKKFVMALRSDNPGATAVSDVTADPAAGATRQFGINDRLRFRSTVVGTGSFTYSLSGIAK